jgi:mRNA interferase YafQ
MRTIERTAQFKRDYKRESKGRHRDVLDALLMEVLMHLVHRKRLQIKYRDHALSNASRGLSDFKISARLRQSLDALKQLQKHPRRLRRPKLALIIRCCSS